MQLLFLLTIFISLLFAEAIRFAPLPMDIAPKLHEQYSSMLTYLEKETGLTFEFVYCANYEEIFQKVKNKEIDIVELGPLPYVKLQQHMPQMQPMLTFLTQSGQPSYTCKLFTYDQGIESLNDPKITTKHFYLTSEHSTCGPLMMGEILKTYSHKLTEFETSYAITHSNVVLQNLLMPNSLGGIKSSVYKHYAHLGLKELGTSQKIPGFTFAVNRELISSQIITKIQNAILKLHPLSNPQDWEITKKWGKNIRYGAVKTQPGAYSGVIEAWEMMQHD